MRRSYEGRVLTWRARAAIRLRSQYLPQRATVKLVIQRGTRIYRVSWHPREGYTVTAWGVAGPPRSAYHDAGMHPLECPRMMRRTPPAAGLPALPLDSESKVLARLPLIREFLSATAYEDQSPRQPGYLTLKNRGGSYEITVYDPDAGLRCAVRAMTLDDVLAATELLLGTADAPWEVDRWLTDQLAKNRKKRA